MLIKILLFALILLSGCSTYSKKECLEMDQETLGYKDGSNGIGSFEATLKHYKET